MSDREPPRQPQPRPPSQPRAQAPGEPQRQPPPAPPSQPPPLPPEAEARVQALRAQIGSRPDARAAYLQLAQILSEHGRPAESAAVLEQYLKVDPGNRFVAERLDLLRGRREAERQRALQAPRPSAAVIERDRRVSRLLLVVVAAVVLVAAVAAGFWLLFPAARPLVVGPADATAPQWSPDGRWIAYFERREDGSHLMVRDLDRRLSRELARIDSWLAEVVWSPDGSRLAYVGPSAESWADEVRMVDPLDGSSRTVAEGSRPSWSADGKHLALVCAPSEAEPDERICLAEVASGELKVLAPGSAESLAVAPGGRLVAFDRIEEPSQAELASAERLPEGGDLSQFAEDALARDPRNLGGARAGVERAAERHMRRGSDEPGWSPPSNLWTVSLDGGAPVQLTDDRRCSRPRWTADGRLLFLYHPDGMPAELWSMAADGSDRRPLLSGVQPAPDPLTVSLTAGPRRAVYLADVPGVSPMMAQTLGGATPRDLYLVELGKPGAVARRIEGKHQFKQGFSLSPDGRRLVYLALDPKTRRSGLWLTKL